MKDCLSKNNGPCWWALRGDKDGDIVSRINWHIQNGPINGVWAALLTDCLSEIMYLRGLVDGKDKGP